MHSVLTLSQRLHSFHSTLDILCYIFVELMNILDKEFNSVFSARNTLIRHCLPNNVFIWFEPILPLNECVAVGIKWDQLGSEQICSDEDRVWFDPRFGDGLKSIGLTLYSDLCPRSSLPKKERHKRSDSNARYWSWHSVSHSLSIQCSSTDRWDVSIQGWHWESA